MNYGRYEIVKELGKGSMGVVYQAHDPNIDRTIALKVLRPDRVSSDDFVQRFLKEARAIGRMSHPNIVAVYDVGEDQGTVYIAMEFLEGVSLNVYRRSHEMGMEDIVHVALQMAGSLDYAHARGIVHRDIKPQNIMIADDGTVKITDFGIAHIEDPEASHQTQAGEILGTPNYMSPEQVLGKKVDGRSDLFSLGVILYELTTGLRPFKGDNMAAIFHDITSGSPVNACEANPGVPASLSGVIMKCLQKDPGARYQTGRELVDALNSFLKGQEQPAAAAASIPEPARKKGMAGIFAAAAFAVVLIAAGIVLFSGGKHEQTKELPKAPAPTGALKVESTPGGAQLYVDGSFKGKTPMSLTLEAKDHEVKLTLPEYYDWEAQVKVEKDREQPLSVQLIKME